MSFGPPTPAPVTIFAPAEGAPIDDGIVADVTINALGTAYARGRVVVSDVRVSGADNGPAAEYRISNEETPQALGLLWFLPYTMPTPLPGSANAMASTGATAATRGVLRLLVRGANITARLRVYPLTLPSTLGTPGSDTVTIGATEAWASVDVLLPTGLDAGDLCALQVQVSSPADTTGTVTAWAIIEPPVTDLTP